MADIIVKEKELLSTITSNICSTRSRTTALGYLYRNTYSENLLMKKKDVITGTQTVVKNFTISNVSNNGDIPASGGSRHATATLTYYQATRTTYKDGSTSDSTYTLKTASITGADVSGEDLDVTPTSRTKKGDSTPSYTFGTTILVLSGNDTTLTGCTLNGRTITSSTSSEIYLQANTASYGNVGTLTITLTKNIPASTLTLSTSNVTTYFTRNTPTLTVTYTSGHTRAGEVSFNWTGNSTTIASRGTTLSNADIITINLLTCTATGEGSKTSTANTGTSANRDGNFVVGVTALASTGHTYHVSYSPALLANANTTSPSSTGLARFQFSSGASTTSSSTAPSFGGTATYTRTYTEKTDSTNTFTVATNGTVTPTNRGTTIGNSRSVVVTATLVVKYVHPTDINGSDQTSDVLSQDITLTQPGNYVTGITFTSKLIYVEAGAGEVRVTPTKSVGTVTYKFTSGSSTTTKPGTTYGTLSAVSWDNTAYSFSSSSSSTTGTNGFTLINTSTGQLGTTSRGTTYGAASRSSGTVYGPKATYTWTHATTYSAGGTVSNTLRASGSCSLEANVVTSVEVNKSGALSYIPPVSAGAEGLALTAVLKNNPANFITTGTLFFKSGSAINGDLSSYGSLGSISYRWSKDEDWLWIASPTSSAEYMAGTVASRGKVRDENTRSGNILRTATALFTLSSAYGGTSFELTCGAALPITLAANSASALVTTGSAGAITASPTSLNSGGGSVSISSTTAATAVASARLTITFDSGSTQVITPSSMTYSWYTSLTWATLSSSNSVGPKTVTVEATTVARSFTTTRRVTYAGSYDGYDYSAYKNATTSSISLSAPGVQSAAIITGSAGAINGVSVNAKAHNTTGDYATISNKTAATAAADVRIKVIDDAGEETTVTPTSLSYSWSSNLTWATLTTSNTVGPKDVSVASRGTSYSTSNRTATITRTVTYTYTFNGISNTISTSCSATLTLTANTVTTSCNASAGAITGNTNISAASHDTSGTYVAVNNNTSPTTAGNVTITLTFTSGSTKTYTAASRSISWGLTGSVFTITNTNAESTTLSVAGRGTTCGDARSTTVTRTATYSCTHEGTTFSAAKGCTATFTQVANVVTRLTLSGGGGGSISTSGTLTAALSTVTVNDGTAASYTTATLTFTSGNSSTAISSYGTITGPSYTYSVSGTGFSISSKTVTASSRGTSYSTSTRDGTITRTATWTFNPTNSTIGTSKTDTKTCTVNTSLPANLITSVVVNAGAFSYPNADADNREVSPTNITSASVSGLSFSSGSQVTDYSNYGTVGSISYQYTTSSGVSSINSSTGYITTREVMTSETITVTRRASITFTRSSTYGGGSISGAASTTTSFTNGAGTGFMIFSTIDNSPVTLYEVVREYGGLNAAPLQLSGPSYSLNSSAATNSCTFYYSEVINGDAVHYLSPSGNLVSGSWRNISLGTYVDGRLMVGPSDGNVLFISNNVDLWIFVLNSNVLYMAFGNNNTYTYATKEFLIGNASFRVLISLGRNLRMSSGYYLNDIRAYGAYDTLHIRLLDSSKQLISDHTTETLVLGETTASGQCKDYSTYVWPSFLHP